VPYCSVETSLKRAAVPTRICVRRAPFNSGFCAGIRAKTPRLQAGLYCSQKPHEKKRREKIPREKKPHEKKTREKKTS
jgi:hypothetical protein